MSEIGAMLAGGGIAAGRNGGLGAAIEAYGAGLREAKAYRQMAVDGLGMEKDQVDKMSLAELKGHMQAVAYQSKLAEDVEKAKNAEANRRMTEAHTQYYQGQAALKEQQTQDNQTVGAVLQNYFQAPDVPTGVGDTMRPATPMEGLKYAFSKTPDASGRHLPQTLDAISKIWQTTQTAGGEDALKPVIDKESLPNNAIVTYGKSMSVVPTGEAQVKQIETGNGKTRTVIVDARGNIRELKSNEVTSRTVPVMNFGMPTGEMQTIYSGPPEEVQKLLDEQQSGKPRGKTTATDAAPTKARNSYKTKAEVVADFEAGLITWPAAAKILNSQFGVPLKK